MDKQKALEVLFAVAQEDTYDSEYDGVSDTYCCHCHSNLSRGDHDEDCLMYKAQEALGDKWLEAKAKEKAEAEERRKQTWGYQIEKVSCPNCGKKVKRVGLKDHIRDSDCSALSHLKEAANS